MYDLRAQYECNTPGSLEQLWHITREGALVSLCGRPLSPSAEAHSLG
ncbi:hypothetical protein ABIA33_003376 [Streptacidiphilus sp. MAP12-16]